MTKYIQILYTSKTPQVKRPDVAGALKALREVHALDADSEHTLHDAYVLFRRIENRIRMMLGRSASALPDSEQARADLAGRLAIEGELNEIVQNLKKRVHGVYLDTLHACRNAT